MKICIASFTLPEFIFTVYVIIIGIMKIIYYIKCKKAKSPCSNSKCARRNFCFKYKNYDSLDYLSDLLKEISKKRGVSPS